MSDLRTRIAQAIYDNVDDYIRRLLVRPSLPGAAEVEGDYKSTCYVLADAVIRELPELKRIDHIRQICVASMNQDRDDSSSDRRWLADSILNILNGTTDG